ncbi:hypothetical protein [Rhodococcus sp. IEGM 1330]|uniref:hypothetical protein n=1 Tax=Rhodococcus sp. IEGM 1330 TaxID=3082225 RepID=UPI002954C9CD|nr:hypothetical protein [Rhodococcus sp. IEGM 1330]MDV8022258.1 hypothetical protein [Rhodococcus sp. IEGM 1330]
MRESIAIRRTGGAWWPLGGPGHTDRDAWIIHGLNGVFSAAPRTPTRTSRAYQIGSTPRMTKIEERLVDFKVRLEGRTRADLEELYAEWNNTWEFEQDLEFRTKSEVFGDRVLRLRLDREMQPDVTSFNMQSTRMEIEMVTVACWPFLGSDAVTIEKDFGVGTTNLTFPIDNPTDVPLWMEWGGSPFTALQLPDALSGRMVPIPAQADVWKVRTRKTFETLSSATDGTNEWAKMRGVSFMYEIPKRTTTPVNLPVAITASAPGKIRAIMRRNHEMPWG